MGAIAVVNDKMAFKTAVLCIVYFYETIFVIDIIYWRFIFGNTARKLHINSLFM